MASYLSPGSDELSFADDHGTAESENESVSSNDQDEQEEEYNDSSSESEEEYEEEMKEENSRPSNASKKGRSSSGSGKASAAAATKKKRSSTGSKSKEKTVEEKYQKKTQLEHILLRPDTYIGSTQSSTQPMFILNSQTNRIHQKEITYTPGFYKIYDEILVNAADNKQRDPNMDKLEVNVDVKRGVISVLNNGKGIPVVMHKEHECYVPSLIFGQLLTGSNFDDDEKKTTGGRNGYGAKLANIFSKKFTVECADTSEGLKFTQVWRNNMSDAEEPDVEELTSSEAKKGDYVKITFKPDFEKFNMSHLDDDAAGLLSKRAYDIAAAMSNQPGKKLKVYLNGEKLGVKDFKSYLALFDDISPPEVYEKINDRWEVGVGSVLDGGGFQQISFVNAISTTKGGGHVDYVTKLISTRLQAAVNKKNKGGKDVKPAQVKNHLSVFVNCLVENPTFDSQTKENLATKPATFKSEVKLTDDFMKKVEKCGVVESIMQFAKFQEGRALQRKGGTKKSKVKGISKLDDANNAGTSKSKDCTLIITEGDSAKSLAVSGLSVVGRDYYGVFPLKGKPLNVRTSTHAQIMKNEEIMNLVEIMGLKFKQVYTEDNIKTLRYGHLMIMADQDHDGSHIKGLVINLIHHFWPSLLDVPGFLQQFITPIVKCTKGKKSETFFTLPEYEEWKKSTGNDAKGWKVKYYKGLGTSTSGEAKEYFSNLDTHEIHFNELSTDHVTRDELNDDDDDEKEDDILSSGAGLIELAFDKTRAEERKKWLAKVQKDTYLNYSEAQKNGMNCSDFINRELILFSQADNARSIPHLLDGFKPSQRKVLFACFKKKLKNEIKVAQLAGYIGEHSAYHHGEMSLHGTIVGMAQTFVGSNNINLLYPSGQFGTRRMGGKDCASARYIFTRLEKIARAIFHPDDDALLNYLNDDGMSIEPDYYMPVIPMILVNGSNGIGTGWSSTIQSHDPREIIANIRRLIDKEEPEKMHPSFSASGWTGEIIPETGRKEGTYTIKGKIKRISNTTLLITELPIGKWTQNYKETVLEKMLASSDKADDKKKKSKSKKKGSDEDDDDDDEVDTKPKAAEILDFKENHTDTTVSFTITATKESIDSFENTKAGGLLKAFKLTTSVSTKNMTAFDKEGKIRQFDTSLDILKEFFNERQVFYIARKDILLDKMQRDLSILENKARFVEEVCAKELVVSDRKRVELLAELNEKGYDLFPKTPKEEEEAAAEEEKTDEDGDTVMEEEDTPSTELAKGYEYLLGMKIWNLTFEKAEELRRQKAGKSDEVEKLKGTSHKTIWKNDLDAIEELLDERDKMMGLEAKKDKKNKALAVRKRTKNGKKKQDEWDSDQSEEESVVSSSEEEEDEDDFVAAKPVSKKAPAKKKDDKSSKRKSKEMSDEDEELDSDEEAFLRGSKPVASKKAPVKEEEKKSSKRKSLDEESEESDDDESVAPKKKAASKQKKKAAPKVKTELSDTDEDSDDSMSVKKKKTASKQKKTDTKVKPSSKSKKPTKADKPRKSSGSASAPKAKSSKGKAASISMGISPKLSISSKKSKKKASKSSRDEEAEALVDSESDAASPQKKESKSKGFGGLKRKSSASRKRKSALQQALEEENENNYSQSPQKKARSSDEESVSSASSGEESEY